MDNVDKQYKTILEAIHNTDVNKEEIYNKLMKIENNVLDTINRVSEYETKKNDKTFFDLSIYEVIAIFANTWKNIFTEIFIDKQYKSVQDIFTTHDRKIYVGLMFIFIACIIGLILFA